MKFLPEMLRDQAALIFIVCACIPSLQGKLDRTYARVMEERTTETQSTRRNESLRGFLRKSY